MLLYLKLKKEHLPGAMALVDDTEADKVNPVIIGDATLYHGDCRGNLPTLPKVDAVITDPPYSDKTHSNAKVTLVADRASGIERLSTSRLLKNCLPGALLFAMVGLLQTWIGVTLRSLNLCRTGL